MQPPATWAVRRRPNGQPVTTRGVGMLRGLGSTRTREREVGSIGEMSARHARAAGPGPDFSCSGTVLPGGPLETSLLVPPAHFPVQAGTGRAHRTPPDLSRPRVSASTSGPGVPAPDPGRGRGPGRSDCEPQAVAAGARASGSGGARGRAGRAPGRRAAGLDPRLLYSPRRLVAAAVIGHPPLRAGAGSRPRCGRPESPARCARTPRAVRPDRPGCGAGRPRPGTGTP
jgi:hypothetical protein